MHPKLKLVQAGISAVILGAWAVMYVHPSLEACSDMTTLFPSIQVYEMLAGKSLFPTDIGRPSHVAIIIVTFGDFPVDLIKGAKYSEEFFKDGKRNANYFCPELILWMSRQVNSSSTFKNGLRCMIA